jgi:hypothetical protein
MVRACKTCSRRTDRATVLKCSLGLDGDPGVDLEHGCYWYEGAETPPPRLSDIAFEHLGRCEN